MNKIQGLFESKCEDFIEAKSSFSFIKSESAKKMFYEALKQELLIGDDGIELFKQISSSFISDKDRIKKAIKERGIFKIKDDLKDDFLNRFCENFREEVSLLFDWENYKNHKENYTKIEKNDDLKIISIKKFIGVEAVELEKFELGNDDFIDIYFQKVMGYYINSNMLGAVRDIKDELSLDVLYDFSKTKIKQYKDEKVFYFTLNINLKYSDLIDIGEFGGEKYLIESIGDTLECIDKIIGKSEAIFDDYSYELF